MSLPPFVRKPRWRNIASLAAALPPVPGSICRSLGDSENGWGSLESEVAPRIILPAPVPHHERAKIPQTCKPG